MGGLMDTKTRTADLGPELYLVHLLRQGRLRAELRAILGLLDSILDVREHRLPATLKLADEARSRLRAILGEHTGAT